MSHLNPTIAQHMRQSMLDLGRIAITRADRDLLDECAHRCTHTNLTSARSSERYRRIFQALELSALFLKDKERGQSGWRVEYRLLEMEEDVR